MKKYNIISEFVIPLLVLPFTLLALVALFIHIGVCGLYKNIRIKINNYHKKMNKYHFKKIKGDLYEDD